MTGYLSKKKEVVAFINKRNMLKMCIQHLSYSYIEINVDHRFQRDGRTMLDTDIEKFDF